LEDFRLQGATAGDDAHDGLWFLRTGIRELRLLFRGENIKGGIQRPFGHEGEEILVVVAMEHYPCVTVPVLARNGRQHIDEYPDVVLLVPKDECQVVLPGDHIVACCERVVPYTE